jgi:hypothetical protein
VRLLKEYQRWVCMRVCRPGEVKGQEDDDGVVIM